MVAIPMAKVVNLNRARKAKARRDKEATADRSRSAHGRTKADKRASKAERDRLARAVVGARRDPSRCDADPPEDPGAPDPDGA